MLTPEQMDGAGELTAAVYRQIEAELLDYLVGKMVEGDVSGQRAQTALALLSQTMPVELKRAVDAHSAEIDAAVKADVSRALAASDAWDLAAIAEGLGVELAADALTAQTLSVTASVRGVIARDNVEMNAAAWRQYMKWADWAATQVATGNMTADRAKHVAVRKLAREGLSINWIQYRDPETGERTVRARADVAVQRHIRTLIAQGAAQLTMRRCEESGCGFVEVSSHIGARPSHAEWHGRCYHIGGDVEVDGVKYRDFHEGTGYQGIKGPYTALGDQLLGVNCRHSFAPWTPGMPRAYSPDPEHPSGLSNDEVYELTQRQRAVERDIRDCKRDGAAAQKLYDASPTAENQVELAKANKALRRQQERMRELIRDANAKCKPGTEVLVRQPQREWAGDMPKGRLQLPQPANRTLDEFLDMPSVEAARKRAGLTKPELRGRIRAELGVAKGERDDFHLRSAEQQREALDSVLLREGGARRPPVEWRNDAVSALEDEKAVAAYLKETHGITASAGFSALPLERQKAVVAGIEDTRAKYGPLDAKRIDVLDKDDGDQGAYGSMAQKIFVHPTLGDGFVIGVHEAAHARDAFVSQKMPGFDKKHPDEAYNLHSEKVLADAKGSLSVKANQRKYIDWLTQIFGNNTLLYKRLKDSPKEIVAYAIDYEASTKGNELSHAIAERFGK